MPSLMITVSLFKIPTITLLIWNWSRGPILDSSLIFSTQSALNTHMKEGKKGVLVKTSVASSHTREHWQLTRLPHCPPQEVPFTGNEDEQCPLKLCDALTLMSKEKLWGCRSDKRSLALIEKLQNMNTHTEDHKITKAKGPHTHTHTQPEWQLELLTSVTLWRHRHQ